MDAKDIAGAALVSISALANFIILLDTAFGWRIYYFRLIFITTRYEVQQGGFQLRRSSIYPW